MVQVRRPAARGGGGRGSSSGGVVAKCIAYGKFALLGGLLVVLSKLLFSVTSSSSITGSNEPPKNSILNIRKDQQLLRNSKNNNNPVNSDSILRTPPNFVQERLERRKHDGEEHPHEEEKQSHDEGADLIDQERQKRLEKHQDQEHNDDTQRQQEEGAKENGVAERLSGDADNTSEDEEANKSQKIQYVSPNGDVLEKPEGTGPTKLGFVMDFVHERGHPKFRHSPTQKIETSRQNHAQIVETALSETNVQPCEYSFLGDDSASKRPKLYQKKECRDPERPLAVYNGATFPRTWCGVSIPPMSAVRLEDHHHDSCKEPVHLLERDFPPPSGEGMSPIIIHAQPDGTVPAADALQEVEQCSVPCQMEKDMGGISRFVQGTDWKIYYSDQDPGSHRDIQTELSKFKHDEYYSTPYFKSDVPLTRLDTETHNLRDDIQPAIDFDSALDKGVYIANENCGGTGSRRTRWMETLQTQYNVDSVGKCQRSTEPEAGDSIDTREGRVAIMKKYKFNLGFEISTYKDWITDVSYEALLSGAVPIILGASNANQHYPRNSAIFTSSYNSWDKLSAYVLEVAKNKTLWESYHAWRNDEAELAAFEKKYQFTKTSPECRMCSWAYAKMYGLGWDHQMQEVKDTYIPRKLCIDEDSGLVAQPFQEVWASGPSSSLGPPEGSEGSCKALTSVSNKNLERDGWSVVKSMVQHDGITDITIHDVQGSEEEEITLTFAFKDVNNTEAAFFRNSHTQVETERGMLMSSATLQDHKSKVTVLANWETKVWSPRQGLIRIVVRAKNASTLHEDEVRRIRLITEDMGQLHDKMTEYFPSSFSKQMIQDFVDPLEVFYLDS